MIEDSNRERGYVYMHRNRSEKLCYVAELNLYGHKIRREFDERANAQQWLHDVNDHLKDIHAEYEEEIFMGEHEMKEEIYEKLMARLKPSSKYNDLRFKDTARANGLVRTEHFQTYLVLDKKTGLVKIGKTHDIYTRISVMGREGRLLLARYDKDLETVLHAKLKKKRFGGEWFSLEASDIDEIITLYNFVDMRDWNEGFI